MPICRQTDAVVETVKEMRSVQRVDSLFIYTVVLPCVTEKKIFWLPNSGSICSLVSQNVKHLYVDVCALNGFDLCSFVDYYNNDLGSPVTMTYGIRDATDFEIRPLQKRSTQADNKEAMTLLSELSRCFVEFQCKAENKREPLVKDPNVNMF